MSKPLSKTARRYNSSNEQKLETLITMYDNAVRAGNLERAAAKRVEIDAVKAEMAAAKARAAARAERQRKASFDKWYEETMALAKAGIRK
jgi:hypothetical protein